jgi:hypothetical protein
MSIRCRGNPFTEQLPGDNPGTVDVLTDRSFSLSLRSNCYTRYNMYKETRITLNSRLLAAIFFRIFLFPSPFYRSR